ncbi:MAG: hypothetical protein H7A40_02160 [Chlamydiales bacterium]|nr:hypothetical protein [Chlamydiales bacterium]
MKKASIVFTIACTLIGTAPLSASYWSEIQEYLPQWGDFIPTCEKKQVEEPCPVEVVEEVAEAIVAEETPAEEEQVVVESKTGLNVAIGMQNLVKALKKEPFFVKGSYHIASERGAFLLVQNLAAYAKNKEVLVAFKSVRVAGFKFFQKPNLGASQYFSLLEKFAQTPLKLDEAFVLNELKAIALKMSNKKLNAHATLGHLCALHALVDSQDEDLAIEIGAVISKFKKCRHKQNQVAALASNLHKVINGREKRA